MTTVRQVRAHPAQQVATKQKVLTTATQASKWTVL